MNAQDRRFPAEWEKQQAILLCFPQNKNDWPSKLDAIVWVFVDFIKKITIYQKVIVLVPNVKIEALVTDMIANAHIDLNRVIFKVFPTNRNWMRDTGPIIVMNKGRREVIDFGFTGWAKYKDYQKDNDVASIMATHLGIPCTKAYNGKNQIVLEGGAIETNGNGTLITTEECLLHPTIQVRNKDFLKEDYEKVFNEYLGITNVIWLAAGIEGDDTHGHIDDICRFVNADTVVACVEKDSNNTNYTPLQDNLKRLKQAKLENGNPLRVIELPMPAPIYFQEMRLPCSYANFLIINGCVLVPTFNDINDRIALNILAECFPDRDIIGINSVDLILGLGTLHCLSQQIPE